MALDVALDERRRAYAADIASRVGLKTPGLEEAFATVSREAFLPPGPWVVVGERDAPRQTPSDDPRLVYDWDDAFFLPLSGFSAVSRPGPNLAIHVRRALNTGDGR